VTSFNEAKGFPRVVHTYMYVLLHKMDAISYCGKDVYTPKQHEEDEEEEEKEADQSSCYKNHSRPAHLLTQSLRYIHAYMHTYIHTCMHATVSRISQKRKRRTKDEMRNRDK
jgi:hypothetical protein